jgi:diaminohydroxyphosphoribosylaminopyrimidine deaminase/5-amino-6-(5-phosphoribosylamino)uracil reductase
VGCILFDPGTNQIVATGATQKGGKPHAEMVALQKAEDLARGCIAYVTLEPCDHTSPGKPLSCCDALISAGVSCVVIAMPDPDARVAGQSIAKLRAHGIETHVGTDMGGAFLAHRGHITRLALGRPFVTLKLAHSKDNKIGMSGMRIPISTQESWQRVYALRGMVDAVMVGINTALADDPLLTDRNGNKQPIRIIMDRRAQLPLASKLVRTANEVPLWVVTDNDHLDLADAGATFIPDLPLPELFRTFGKMGLTHILVEGGATLAKALLKENLIDEAIMIEGDVTLGSGIPAPDIKALNFRDEDRVGIDIWRYYDSDSALNIRRGFFDAATKFQPV